VTFIAAQNFLRSNDVAFGGHMTVAMVLMESPAIIMAVLPIGSLAIGCLTGEYGASVMQPFTGAISNGILSMALGVTFLFNILLGIALYFAPSGML